MTTLLEKHEPGLGLFRCLARTEMKLLWPEIPDEALLKLNEAVTEAYKLGAQNERRRTG